VQRLTRAGGRVWASVTGRVVAEMAVVMVVMVVLMDGWMDEWWMFALTLVLLKLLRLATFV
jgi:hypothetical protein